MKIKCLATGMLMAFIVSQLFGATKGPPEESTQYRNSANSTCPGLQNGACSGGTCNYDSSEVVDCLNSTGSCTESTGTWTGPLQGTCKKLGGPNYTVATCVCLPTTE